ncbi:hypothetical protein BCT73_06540 [Vibrio breoganii]|uniref:hypothetical protein n=1 Tax=Vibrio breoganii TaxID=553239 RepID=UPI000C81F210|nr:hypothetical protein [Vibrio breoganii]PML61243.1 hypothetical protein BCT73_06540 [Vibrio breoganii]
MKIDKLSYDRLLLIIIIITSLIVLNLLSNKFFAIYFVQYIFVIFIYSKLEKTTSSILVVFYPVFKIFWYSLYSDNWYVTGDVINYMTLLSNTFVENGLNLDTISLINGNYVRYYYLTVINILYPMIKYNIDFGSSDMIYLLYFNDIIYLLFLAWVTIEYKIIFRDKEINFLVIFMLLSPSMLAFTAINDRHMFTLFGLLLLAKSIFEYNNTKKVSLLLIISLLIIYLNKKELLIGFSLYLLIINREKLFSGKNIVIFGFLVLSLVFLFKSTILHYISAQGFKTTGISQDLGLLSSILIIPIKYLYAMLAPFPWFKLEDFIGGYYGSYLVLLSWFANSIFSFVLFYILMTNRSKYRDSKYYSSHILLGVVMTLTIVFGSIGHAQYLTVYYPLLIPLFFTLNQKEYFKAISLSIFTLVTFNGIAFFTY